MIYRGVKMTDESAKRKDRRDVLKAIVIAAGVILVIAGLVVLARTFTVQ